MSCFNSINFCDLSLHKRSVKDLHSVIHLLQTGDLVFAAGFGLRGWLIQLGTRATYTHIMVVVRLSDCPSAPTMTGSDPSIEFKKGYLEFIRKARSVIGKHPKICSRDCLNDVCLLESTNYQDSRDVLLERITLGCHLTNAFEKLTSLHYKYLSVRYASPGTLHFGRKEYPSIVATGFLRPSLPEVFLARIFEFTYLVYGKKYDGHWASIFVTMHKSFTNPQSARTSQNSCLYTNAQLCGFLYWVNRCNKTLCHNSDSDSDEDLQEFEPQNVAIMPRKSQHTRKPKLKSQSVPVRPDRKYVCQSVHHLFENYSRKEAFFCSSLVAALLRYCNVIDDGPTKKYDDNEFCPDDFSNDDMLKTLQIRYSDIEHFMGHNISMVWKDGQCRYFSNDISNQLLECDVLLKFHLLDECPQIPHWDIKL